MSGKTCQIDHLHPAKLNLIHPTTASVFRGTGYSHGALQEFLLPALEVADAGYSHGALQEWRTQRQLFFTAMTHQEGSRAGNGLADKANIDWPTVLAQHDRWLRTVAFSRLRERDAVDEVMQEVALAAVRQAAPLADPNKVAPWLYRLAVRQVLLYRRRKGRQRKLAARYADRAGRREEEVPDADPLSWLLACERRRLVRTALEQLPERDAEILMLKYAENWDYHQIAARLGVSHSAVESRLHRARQRLRHQLAAMEVIEVRS